MIVYPTQTHLGPKWLETKLHFEVKSQEYVLLYMTCTNISIICFIFIFFIYVFLLCQYILTKLNKTRNCFENTPTKHAETQVSIL